MRPTDVGRVRLRDESTGWGSRLVVQIDRTSTRDATPAELDARQVAALRDVCDEWLVERAPHLAEVRP